MDTDSEVGGRTHLRLALLVGWPYKPSISPTLKKSQVMKSAILQDQLLSTSNSFAMATVNLSHVQFWQAPLNLLSSKRASPHTRENGRSGLATSQRH